MSKRSQKKEGRVNASRCQCFCTSVSLQVSFSLIQDSPHRCFIPTSLSMIGHHNQSNKHLLCQHHYQQFLHQTTSNSKKQHQFPVVVIFFSTTVLQSYNNHCIFSITIDLQYLCFSFLPEQFTNKVIKQQINLEYKSYLLWCDYPLIRTIMVAQQK